MDRTKRSCRRVLVCCVVGQRPVSNCRSFRNRHVRCHIGGFRRHLDPASNARQLDRQQRCGDLSGRHATLQRERGRWSLRVGGLGLYVGCSLASSTAHVLGIRCLLPQWALCDGLCVPIFYKCAASGACKHLRQRGRWRHVGHSHPLGRPWNRMVASTRAEREWPAHDRGQQSGHPNDDKRCGRQLDLSLASELWLQFRRDACFVS